MQQVEAGSDKGLLALAGRGKKSVNSDTQSCTRRLKQLWITPLFSSYPTSTKFHILNKCFDSVYLSFYALQNMPMDFSLACNNSRREILMVQNQVFPLIFIFCFESPGIFNLITKNQVDILQEKWNFIVLVGKITNLTNNTVIITEDRNVVLEEHLILTSRLWKKNLKKNLFIRCQPAECITLPTSASSS